MMTPSIVDRTVVHAGYLRVETLRIRLASGAVVHREMEHHGDAVAVLPYDPVNRTALVVRLFRAPPFVRTGITAVDEACAGMIEDEDEAQTARREAQEELGLTLGPVDFIGTVWASPGVSGERVSLFLAPYAPSDRTAAGGGVASENEDITVVERGLADLAADAEAGAITDMKLLVLTQSLRLRRPDLF